MDKIVKDIDLDVKDKVAHLEDELLNPSNNLNAPVVEIAVDGGKLVTDAESLLHKTEDKLTDIVDMAERPIGFPGHGV